METVLLSWRFQNLVTIALMVILISFIATFGVQAFKRAQSSK